MAKYLVALDMGQNEIQNVVMHVLATAPQTPVAGQFYFNSVDNKAYQYDGRAWKTLGATLLSEITADADFSMASHKIVNLAPPTAAGDAANKGYIDGKIADLGTVFDIKGSVDLKEADPEHPEKTYLPLSGNNKGDVWTVLEDGSEYFWNSSSASGTIADYEPLGKTVDLSGYAPLASPALTGTPTINGEAAATVGDVADAVGALIKRATGTIGTSAVSAVVPYSGTLISAYALMNGNIVMCDMAVTASAVTFSTALSPASAVTCVVIYA